MTNVREDAPEAEPLLRVRDLCVEIPTEEGLVYAVNGASFDLREGEVIGLVGESGCGKTMTALSVIRLIPPPGRIVGGQITLRGRDLLALPAKQMREIRGNEIAMVFQDPMSSLNPVMPIGRQVSEALELHLGMSRSQAKRRVIELLGMVGIPDARSRVEDTPHQFSGGMRQRVMIAMALACEPKIIIADEPTTALDVTIQAQILELLGRLRDETHTAIIVITHDLGVIAGIADRVTVMYAGQVMEAAAVHDLFERPSHPYTLGLLRSMPRFDHPRLGTLPTIEGQPPDLVGLPLGCPFFQRCPYRLDPKCRDQRPPLREVEPGHWVATYYDREKGIAT